METSKTSGQATAASRSLPQVMRRHPLFFFFLMAYAFSWIVLIPFVLSVWGILPKFFIFTFYLNPFLGPTLAAFIMTGITEGKAGVLRLLHRYIQWRAGWQWYLFILLGIPALLVLAIMVLPGALASFHGLPPLFLVIYPVSFVVTLILGGPLGEEPGWCGFAAPHATVLWFAVENYHPECLVGLLAPATFPDAGAAWRAGYQLRYLPHELPYVRPVGHSHGHHLYVGLQPHRWEPVHRYLAACQRRYLTELGIILSRADRDQYGPVRPHRLGVAALLIVILIRGRLGYQPGQEQPLRHGGSRGAARPLSASPGMSLNRHRTSIEQGMQHNQLHTLLRGMSMLLPQIELLAGLLNRLLQPLNFFVIIQSVGSVNIKAHQVHERLQHRRELARIIGFNQ